MPRVADAVALTLFCACYLANLGTLIGVDMIWSLALLPIAAAYAYYSRHELRAARRSRGTFPRATQRFLLAAGAYAAVGLGTLFVYELVVGAHITTHAGIVREHGFLVFGFLAFASLFFAYPATRALTLIAVPTTKTTA